MGRGDPQRVDRQRKAGLALLPTGFEVGAVEVDERELAGDEQAGPDDEQKPHAQHDVLHHASPPSDAGVRVGGAKVCNWEGRPSLRQSTAWPDAATRAALRHPHPRRASRSLRRNRHARPSSPPRASRCRNRHARPTMHDSGHRFRPREDRCRRQPLAATARLLRQPGDVHVRRVPRIGRTAPDAPVVSAQGGCVEYDPDGGARPDRRVATARAARSGRRQAPPAARRRRNLDPRDSRRLRSDRGVEGGSAPSNGTGSVSRRSPGGSTQARSCRTWPPPRSGASTCSGRGRRRSTSPSSRASGGRSGGSVRRHALGLEGVERVPFGVHDDHHRGADRARSGANSSRSCDAASAVDQALWVGRDGGALTTREEIIALIDASPPRRGDVRARRVIDSAETLAANVRETQGRVVIDAARLPDVSTRRSVASFAAAGRVRRPLLPRVRPLARDRRPGQVPRAPSSARRSRPRRDRDRREESRERDPARGARILTARGDGLRPSDVGCTTSSPPTDLPSAKPRP